MVNKGAEIELIFSALYMEPALTIFLSNAGSVALGPLTEAAMTEKHNLMEARKYW